MLGNGAARSLCTVPGSAGRARDGVLGPGGRLPRPGCGCPPRPTFNPGDSGPAVGASLAGAQRQGVGTVATSEQPCSHSRFRSRHLFRWSFCHSSRSARAAYRLRPCLTGGCRSLHLGVCLLPTAARRPLCHCFHGEEEDYRFRAGRIVAVVMETQSKGSLLLPVISGF